MGKFTLLLVALSLALFMMITTASLVVAQTDEGRISEHLSSTMVAVAGLAVFAYMIRQFRKKQMRDEV